MPSSSSIKGDPSASASGSSSSSKRKINGKSSSGQLTATEKRIWQAALSETDHVSTIQCEDKEDVPC